ncbi:MAG: hypothetical protein KAS07_04110 [Candidatus Pacebacteria bacterium]|nr:hypothetical protein [Candidatus Paceibacterota bacterium]
MTFIIIWNENGMIVENDIHGCVSNVTFLRSAYFNEVVQEQFTKNLI